MRLQLHCVFHEREPAPETREIIRKNSFFYIISAQSWSVIFSLSLSVISCWDNDDVLLYMVWRTIYKYFSSDLSSHHNWRVHRNNGGATVIFMYFNPDLDSQSIGRREREEKNRIVVVVVVIIIIGSLLALSPTGRKPSSSVGETHSQVMLSSDWTERHRNLIQG